MNMCKRDCRRVSSDDAHESPSLYTWPTANESVGITCLDANALGNVMEFLPTADQVRLLSTCRELSHVGLTSKLETFCGKCAPCMSGVKHACHGASERKWSLPTWQSVLTRHGHSLNELHLVGCTHVSRDAFSSSESRRVLENLRVLRIDMCPALDARGLEELLAMCRRLCQVHIVNMPLDDAGLAVLVTNSRTSLRMLDLTGCHLLVGSGLQALSATHVDTIILEGCHGIKMRELEGMLDTIAQSIAVTLPTLEHLNLRYCYKLSDDGVRAMCSSLVALKTLDLSQCPRITDAAVCAISESLHHLQNLNLLNCRQVTLSRTLPHLNLAGLRRHNALVPIETVDRAWPSRTALLPAWEQAEQAGFFKREMSQHAGRMVRQVVC
ncbi:hypothetical protein DYB32_009034 [Aphanomyces invadans]|uniref:F-box/LRR-repeat protein 15-like leucin rich repeat domain-containing protein n=1 Tax=Aphanomyces invadans TaxID=157072 RepID=A0A418AJH5_9STRA|nr:hypothetical protein DYB32_009034 [Aphanomyces invadans]